MVDRPIDRMIRWGEGEWGMVLGEPDANMLGTPTRMVGKPDHWDELVGAPPLTTGVDDAIFDVVKQTRKEK